MIKAAEQLATIALKAVIALEVQASQHRSIARRCERRLTGPDSLRKTQADVDYHDKLAAEQEALAEALRSPAIEVKVTAQARRERRKAR